MNDIRNICKICQCLLVLLGGKMQSFLNVDYCALVWSLISYTQRFLYSPAVTVIRRRVSSVVEHSSANPKVPGSIPGPVSYRGHGL